MKRSDYTEPQAKVSDYFLQNYKNKVNQSIGVLKVDTFRHLYFLLPVLRIRSTRNPVDVMFTCSTVTMTTTCDVSMLFPKCSPANATLPFHIHSNKVHHLALASQTVRRRNHLQLNNGPNSILCFSEFST